jgi:hypothetical protein
MEEERNIQHDQRVKHPMTRSRAALLPGFICGLYLLWSGVFIYHSSFVAIDGQRYFSLVDDAMVSMRYASNFSHGFGLVWNPNEHVEGYSNLLMTLIMSVATRFLDKKLAVLSIQIMGIGIVLACAWLTREIAKEAFKNHPNRRLLQNLSFISMLFYYPLSYRTLMGMETGLLTALLLLSLLFALRWLNNREGNLLYFSAIAGGLAFLTRNDAGIFSALLFIFVLYYVWTEQRVKAPVVKVFIALSIYSVFVIGLLLFRWAYYGSLVPNTYILKVSNIPYRVRINDGLVYVINFARESFLPLLFALLGFIITRDRIRWIFLALLSGSIIYQIWIGGDVWHDWRFLMPVIPLVFVSSVAGISWISGKFAERIQVQNRSTLSMLTVGIVTISVISLVLPFWRYIAFREEIPDYPTNQHSTNIAIAINAVTTRDARIGVFLAGVIPYYADRYTIDFLGKSDPYIAKLPPRLPRHITWWQQITMPGHNKYDLNYSIRKLQPDYIQRFYWAEQNIRTWATQHYVRLEYTGVRGTITLLVRKDSHAIDWSKGRVIPWNKLPQTP